MSTWRNDAAMLACQAGVECSSAGRVDAGVRSDHAERSAQANARAIARWGVTGDWEFIRNRVEVRR